jgi:hypothetical protein
MRLGAHDSAKGTLDDLRCRRENPYASLILQWPLRSDQPVPFTSPHLAVRRALRTNCLPQPREVRRLTSRAMLVPTALGMATIPARRDANFWQCGSVESCRRRQARGCQSSRDISGGSTNCAQRSPFRNRLDRSLRAIETTASARSEQGDRGRHRPRRSSDS